MSSNKNRGVHITPRADGRWNVSREGASRASFVHETPSGAIDTGRNTASREAIELFVHGRDRQIRDRDPYGRDPYPPEG